MWSTLWMGSKLERGQFRKVNLVCGNKLVPGKPQLTLHFSLSSMHALANWSFYLLTLVPPILLLSIFKLFYILWSSISIVLKCACFRMVSWLWFVAHYLACFCWCVCNILRCASCIYLVIVFLSAPTEKQH